METGDLLLFRGKRWYYRWFDYWVGSVYSHAGIYVRNPAALGVGLPDGEYVWHYSNGVCFERLDDLSKEYEIDVRVVHAERSSYLYRKWAELVQTGFVSIEGVEQGWHSYRFWSAAWVAYVYRQLGWVSGVDWALVSPTELAGKCLRWRVPVECVKFLKMLQK